MEVFLIRHCFLFGMERGRAGNGSLGKCWKFGVGLIAQDTIRKEWEKSTAMVCTDGKAIENPDHGRHLIGCSMTRSQRHYFGTL